MYFLLAKPRVLKIPEIKNDAYYNLLNYLILVTVPYTTNETDELDNQLFYVLSIPIT